MSLRTTKTESVDRVRGPLRAALVIVVAAIAVSAAAGCADWRGLNSLSLPGTEGDGPGSFAVQAQMPDVNNLQQNSRVRVGDVTVGNVTRIERQGWHALVTMRLDSGVDLGSLITADLPPSSKSRDRRQNEQCEHGRGDQSADDHGRERPLDFGTRTGCQCHRHKSETGD